MSHEDPRRPEHGRSDHGAYTPPDDDLSYRRPFRVGGGDGSPPVVLLISLGLLVALIIALVVYYRAGLRPSDDAMPVVGTQVGELRVEPPEEAQPVEPAAGVQVYDRAAETAAEPTFAPPPETAQPRPVAPAAPTAPAPRAATPAAPAPATMPVGGSSSVQIGAFSAPGIADQQYAALTTRYPQFTRGGAKRVQEVSTSNGSTLYRTTITGLSREQAVALCDAIKAGGDDCFVR